MLKEKPAVGFWANSPLLSPRDEVVVVVAAAALDVAAPRPPKLKPPGAEAGVLEEEETIPR